MDDILAKKNRHLFLEEKDNTHNSFISNINYAAENIDTIKTFNDNVNNGTMQYLLEAFTTSLNDQGNAWEVRLTQVGESILATTSAFNYSTVVTVSNDIPANGTLILPNSMKYKVGTHMLMVSWNGTVCYAGDQYDEVGVYGVWATSIKLNQPAKAGDKIQLRIVALTDQFSYIDITEAAINASQFIASGSNTERYLPEFLGDIVNVKNFGAIGNGVNDDTTAFQSAIASEKAVFVPEGTYKLNTDLNGVFCGVGNSTFTGGTINSSTILRGIAQKNSDIINVKDFGAKGDGITDDTISLQNAFNYANTLTHKTVIIPHGVYIIDDVIKIGGNIIVYAYGATLKSSARDKSHNVINNYLGYTLESPGGYNGNSNIVWLGGTLDSNGGNVGDDILRQSMNFAHAKNIIIRDVTFTNCKRSHTLEFAACRDVHVTDCKFLGQYPPVLSGYYPEMVQMDACISSLPENYAFLADDTGLENFVFENCLFTNKEDSLELTETSPYAFIGNHANNTIAFMKNIVVKNCVFKSARHRPFLWMGVDGLTVENCSFNSTDSGYPTIYVIGISKNIRILNNTVIKIPGLNDSNEPVFDNALSIRVLGSNDNYIENVEISGNTTNAKIGASYVKNLLVSRNLLKVDPILGTNDYTYFQYIDTGIISNNLFSGSTSTNCIYLSACSNVSTLDNKGLSTDPSKGDGIALSGTQTSYNISFPLFLFTDNAYGRPQINYDYNKGFRIAGYDGTELKRVLYISASNDVCPGQPELQKLGNAGNKWSEVFASTGTINTSDLREKTDVVEPSERLLRAWGNVRIKIFKFINAVEQKGSNFARKHCGIIAQDVASAFNAEGLNANEYGLFCYDEWPDEVEEIEVVDKGPVLDEKGKEIESAQKHIEYKIVSKAGNSYGIRYEEALALECAYQRWLGEQRDAKIEALMQRISALENNQ